MKIYNFGSLNIDYVYSVEHFVTAGETLPSDVMEVFPGGKGLNQSVALARAGAPKTWVWQLLAAFIVACLLAWSGTAVKVSNPTGNGLEVAGNILSGISHPSTKLLFTFGTNGVPYLLLETFCIAFLGTVVGAVISLPLSFLSASNLVPKGVAWSPTSAASAACSPPTSPG